MQVLPECGDGDTLFADMEDAYQSLDEPTRDKLLGLSAVRDPCCSEQHR